MKKLIYTIVILFPFLSFNALADYKYDLTKGWDDQNNRIKGLGADFVKAAAYCASNYEEATKTTDEAYSRYCMSYQRALEWMRLQINNQKFGGNITPEGMTCDDVMNAWGTDKQVKVSSVCFLLHAYKQGKGFVEDAEKKVFPNKK